MLRCEAPTTMLQESSDIVSPNIIFVIYCKHNLQAIFEQYPVFRNALISNVIFDDLDNRKTFETSKNTDITFNFLLILFENILIRNLVVSLVEWF